MRQLNLIRRFSVHRPVLKDWTFTVSSLESKAQTQGTADRTQHEIFSQIFDSVLAKAQKQDAASAKDKKLSTALDQLFKPTNTVNPAAKLSKPISIVEETKLLENSTVISEQLKQELDRIYLFGTQLQVLDYFENWVIPNFDSSIQYWHDAVLVNKVSKDAIEPILCACLKTLCQFGDPNVAFGLFMRTKRQPRDVVEAAIGSAVYNSIIVMQWEYYRDTKIILDLTSEMSLNAVPGDARTANILSKITQEALMAKKHNIKEKMPLWTSRDDRRISVLLHYRRCIVDAVAVRAGVPRPTFYT